MTKKVARGLLDIVGLEDDEWELEKPSENFMFGMGLGATPEATRWAYKGFRLEIYSQIGRALSLTKRGKGRPSKASEKMKMPQLRAFHMWIELRDMPVPFRTSLTNRQLIEWICKRDDLLPSEAKLWKSSVETQTLEHSLSAGRTFWEIDDNWHSEKCEAFLRHLFFEKTK